MNRMLEITALAEDDAALDATVAGPRLLVANEVVAEQLVDTSANKGEVVTDAASA